jgi:hypothetical protein
MQNDGKDEHYELENQKERERDRDKTRVGTRGFQESHSPN